MSVPIIVRGGQVRPTISETKAAWETIIAAARSGDVQAAAMLVALTERTPLVIRDPATGKATLLA
ncbi:hypothetical protein [Pseudomonas pseudonitroreducens]|uniref:hypothetical protein n=1 Tax=Pseudomonas pseudonitroreducens TaxID=2892326 RepID=UPI001F24740E|nr:hypothetical protein [Pseudomonas pseudonitroreducens]